MEKMEEDLALLWKLLEDEKLFLVGMDFPVICRLAGIDREEMDLYLMDELGFDGGQILMACRVDYVRRLKERYGIVIDD